MVMHAIHVVDNKLVWRECERPTVGLGEVLIKVTATAINRADLSQRVGGYAPPPGASEILGLECSGVVVDAGEGVGSFSEGDEVCALLAGGGYAEYVNVPAGQVLPKPSGVSLIEAAAFPEVFATAYLNIFMEARASQGETVLIHAGASGVGTAAIQMCRLFKNPCFVTVGSSEKVTYCKEIGADDGCSRHDEEFPERVMNWTKGDGADVILDPVGASYLERNLSCLALDGRLVVIGLMGGAQADLSLGRMMMKRQRVIGSTLRARSIQAKSNVIDQLKRKVWPAIESGEIKPIIECVLPIEKANEAHELLATNETKGKVVLQVN